MIAGVRLSGLPTLSQIQEWQTNHLSSAAQRWRGVANAWITVYDDMAAGISAPGGTVWEGEASTAAKARTDADRAAVEMPARRLQAVASFAEAGVAVIDEAKAEALMVIQAAGALGFDVREDLSLVDRLDSRSSAALVFRQQQANVLAIAIRVGAAQLVNADQMVSNQLQRATADFVRLDFNRSPIIDPMSADSDEQSFGACFTENFKEDIGANMVQGVFVGGAIGAARGALLGILGGPLGVLGGGVVGFVGGAAGGAMISGPARTAVTSAWDCL